MTFTSILIAVLVFSVLVLFHEFGHYILAKAVGIGVVEFSLGMGPRILSFTKGETRYSWKAIPFGGSCAMVGEDEDDTAPNAFNSKPAWARFLVVLAGPAFNVILALILSFFLIGMNYIIGNYAGPMAIIELYAMGATFGISLFKWVDWIQGYPAPKRIER